MGSQSQPKLPVIDFSNENLKPGTKIWLETCKKVRQAFEEFGCFEAIYSKLDLQLHNQTFAASKELFDLPIETKIKNTSTKPYFHYYGQYTTLPLYESLCIDNPTNLDSTQSFTNLMWPSGNPLFCENAFSFSKLSTELNEIVTRMLFESYGVGRYCESYIESINYLLRYFKYRPAKKNESTVGLNPHTDKTMTSILYQNEINGLLVKTKDSDQWIDVQLSPSSFVVMAGDALRAWSNDRIQSCWHRVIMNESVLTRYSLGLFSFCKGMVDIHEEFVDDTHPLKYKSFDHFGLIRYHRTKANQTSGTTITEYCGI